MRTFDEAFAELNLKPAEREALVWYLASLRARKTIEALLPSTDPRLLGVKSDVRKNRPVYLLRGR